MPGSEESLENLWLTLLIEKQRSSGVRKAKTFTKVKARQNDIPPVSRISQWYVQIIACYSQGSRL